LRRAAQAIIDRAVDQQRLEQIRLDAAARLQELRGLIDSINSAVRVIAADFDLPEPTVPQAIASAGPEQEPLIDSTWPFVLATQRLVASRAYRITTSGNRHRVVSVELPGRKDCV
jgi:hypothetical protein